MAVPSDPSVTTVVTEGLKRGGKVNPSAAEITSGTDEQFQEVVADIMLRVGHHHLFETQDVDATVAGLRSYDFPIGMFSDPKITLYDGPDDWRGTAQAGASTTITLAATYDEDSETVLGKYVIVTGGTGVDQIKQVTSYNNTSKVATVDSAWSTNPDSSSTYLVSDFQTRLVLSSKEFDLNLLVNRFSTGRPTHFAMQNQTAFLHPIPDKIYGLVREYTLGLDRLDQTGTDFVGKNW